MSKNVVTYESVAQLIRAAVEDEDGDAWVAAVKVQSRLRDDPLFREEVAVAVVDFAIEQLAIESEKDLNPNRFRLPDGTSW